MGRILKTKDELRQERADRRKPRDLVVARQWKKDHPQYVKNRKAEWRKNNSDSERLRARRTNLRLRYGLTPAQFDAIMEEQGGICAMPGCIKQAIRIDHDHETGVVRGILCHRCNILLAGIEDQGFFRSATVYLGRGGTMGLQKYGTGDGVVLPEEGDATTPPPFTPVDEEELVQELELDEPASDSD